MCPLRQRRLRCDRDYPLSWRKPEKSQPCRVSRGVNLSRVSSLLFSSMRGSRVPGRNRRAAYTGIHWWTLPQFRGRRFGHDGTTAPTTQCPKRKLRSKAPNLRFFTSLSPLGCLMGPSTTRMSIATKYPRWHDLMGTQLHKEDRIVGSRWPNLPEQFPPRPAEPIGNPESTVGVFTVTSRNTRHENGKILTWS